MTDVDTLMSVFSHPIRRYTIHHLHTAENPTTKSELAEKIAGTLSTTTSCPDTIEKHLHHQHFPRLEKSTLISWDQNAGTVELDEFSETEQLLIEHLSELDEW